jgi:hypothetical protein
VENTSTYKEAITEEWRQIHKESFHCSYISGTQKNEMGGTMQQITFRDIKTDLRLKTNGKNYFRTSSDGSFCYNSREPSDSMIRNNKY